MNLTDRDRKTILILLILAVIALPYTLYIQDTREDTDKVNAEIVTLNETFNRLNEMNQKRDFYIAETKKYKDNTLKLIEQFPADVRPENYAMFLLNAEYSSDKIPLEVEEGEEDLGLYELEYPIRFKTYGFGDNEQFDLASDEVQLDYTALTNKSSVLFLCKYDALKYMLKYLMDYKDPMIYSTLKLEMDEETGTIAGEMILEQYAIAGQGRTLEDVVVEPDIDKMKMRGVNLDPKNENGVFGSTHIDTWEELEEDEGGDAEGGDAEGGDAEGGDAEAGDAEGGDAEADEDADTADAE
ncbi:MAG: hypothetical protein K5686_05555 [Lachnospiraceae bacterium]|nr:hypothetical protein [Lachnospiraceae bacterium]